MNEMESVESKKVLRVGIYLRLSNEDRDKVNKDDDSESIKNQRNMLVDYIKKHPEFVLIDEYCDEDLSGAGTYRPEFERLIRDCENRKLDIVLCKSQSRFSRDMEIVEKYINNKFKEWNIRFIGLSDNADTLVLGNKKSRQINGLVNEWYLEDVSDNIRSAFNSKMKQGEFISPFAPFGYEISPDDNNKLIVDAIASEIVKNIYDLYLTGLGFTGIAKYLNSKEIPSPSLYKYRKGIKLNVISTEEFKLSDFFITSERTVINKKCALFLVPKMEDSDNELVKMILAEAYQLCKNQSWYFILDNFDIEFKRLYNYIEENAEFLEAHNVAVWLRKKDDPDAFIQELFSNPEKINEMKKNSELLAKRNSTKDICEIIIGLL